MALGDSAETPRLIETLHRRGYRFISPIAASDSQASQSWADSSSENGATRSDAIPARSRRVLWLPIRAALILLLAFAGAFLWLTRPLPPPKVLYTTQITHDGFDKVNMLTDGSRLYIAESTGSRQFLVQVSVAGGETSIFPTPFSNIAISDISPDQSQMLVAEAVGTDNESQVWMLPLPAGAPRRLGDIVAHWDLWSPGWALWSPDGRQLVFAKGSEIYTAKADGADPRKLVALPGSASEMHFSPNGTRLRFTLKNLQSDARSIWEVGSDGSGLHPVFPGWDARFSNLAGTWSPDGRYYFFTSCDDPNGCSVWARREPQGFFHRRATPAVQLTAGPTPVFFNGVSRDGRRLFVSEWSSRSELLRYDAKSRQFLPFLSGIGADEVDFSRDGRWVTYVTSRDHTLCRSRLDGSERVQLTSAPVSAFLPRWSPDGRQIAFVDRHADPFWKILVIPAEGGTPKEILSENQNQLHPSWSPDGKELAFGRVPWLRSSTEKIAIQILDLDSKQVSTIPGSENLFSPRWSPDGRRLAAVTLDNKKLLLFDFATKKWTDWIAEPGAVAYPTWSADGNYLYYDNIQSKRPSYRRVRVGQTRSELLVELTDLQRGIPSLLGPWSGMAPDGSPLFDHDLSTGEVYSLELELP